MDQTPALELCYSCVAEWSPADPDDDEVWDSSRWEWQKTASRLHCKWEWPHPYTPGQVPGERKTIPYHSLGCSWKNKLSCDEEKCNLPRAKRGSSKKVFQVFVLPFPDHQWPTEVWAAVPGGHGAPAHPQLRECGSGAAAVPPVLGAQREGEHSPACPGLSPAPSSSVLHLCLLSHLSPYSFFIVL